MNNLEAKAFAKYVIDRIKNPYKHFIDTGIYSNRHTLRIVGSIKIGSSRVKVFRQSFEYHGVKYTHKYSEEPISDQHKINLILSESLVSHASYCKYLPIIGEVYEPQIQVDDISEEVSRKCVELMNVTMKNPPFRYLRTLGNLIILERIQPSKCPICNKIHDNEHPFLILKNDQVYWDCRRRTNQDRYFLGSIGKPVPLVVPRIIKGNPINTFIRRYNPCISSLTDIADEISFDNL